MTIRGGYVRLIRVVTGEQRTGEQRTAGPPPAGDVEPVDFFVSYTGADEAWATWVGAVLEEQVRADGRRVRVRLQAWDSPAGANFVTWISDQMDAAASTIAICSPTYFDSHWCTAEWTAALNRRAIIPLRVTDVGIPTILATIGYRDLHGGIDETLARRRLLEAVGLAAVARQSQGFPGTSMAPGNGTATEAKEAVGAAEEVFPGRIPVVFSVPPRLRRFTGRQPLLDQIRAGLTDHRADSGSGSASGVAGRRVAITALYGLGGVGKSQLAIEYAHRHAADYDLVLWVDAERTALIPARLAAFAARLDVPSVGQVADDAAAVLTWLGRHRRWLLIYDNAELPAGLRPWLPTGPGHTLITSRQTGWGALADPLEIDVMDRAEAIALLVRRRPALDPGVADELAEVLGDLPLALEQAAAYLDATGTSAARYLARLRTEQAAMLGKGEDLAHGGTIASLWAVTLERLQQSQPGAIRLLELCAQLAPEPIPLTLFQPEMIRPERRQRWWNRQRSGAADIPGGIPDALDTIAAYSLARRTDSSLTLHRLLATVIRTRQTDSERNAAAATIRWMLTARLHHSDPAAPADWPVWEELSTHLTTAPALHPDIPTDPVHPDGRDLVRQVGIFLTAHGDYQAAAALDRTIHIRDRHTLGDNHPDTLTSANNLAADLRQLGEVEAAAALEAEFGLSGAAEDGF